MVSIVMEILLQDDFFSKILKIQKNFFILMNIKVLSIIQLLERKWILLFRFLLFFCLKHFEKFVSRVPFFGNIRERKIGSETKYK